VPVYYTITKEVVGPGQIWPQDVTSVRAGSGTTLEIDPDPGCVISDVLLDTVSILSQTRPNYSTGSRYVDLTNVQAPHTVRALFTLYVTPTPAPTPVYYRVDLLPVIGNGDTSPAPGAYRNVRAGQSLTIWFYPGSGAMLTNVLLDGSVCLGTFNRIPAGHGTMMWSMSVRRIRCRRYLAHHRHRRPPRRRPAGNIL